MRLWHEGGGFPEGFLRLELEGLRAAVQPGGFHRHACVPGHGERFSAGTAGMNAEAGHAPGADQDAQPAMPGVEQDTGGLRLRAAAGKRGKAFIADHSLRQGEGVWKILSRHGCRCVAGVMVVAFRVGMRFGDFAAGAEKHPHGEHEDHRGGGEVKVRLGVLGVPLSAIMQGQRGENPDEQ